MPIAAYIAGALLTLGCNAAWADKSGSVPSREAAHRVIAKAVELRPIDEPTSSAENELRLWLFTTRVTKPMFLLREGPAGVRGEFVIWWGQVYGRWREDPTRRAYDMSAIIRKENEHRRNLVKSQWNCEKHAVADLFEACRVSLRRQPDWSRLLRELGLENVWDLPDGSTLPPDMLADGGSLVVEVRRGGRTRTYSYTNPRHHPGPEAYSAERIMSLVARFERSLEAAK